MDEMISKTSSLFNSIRNKDIYQLDKLLSDPEVENFINIISENNNCETPLILATRLGYVECVTKLLSCSAIDVNQKSGMLEQTPLIVLVKSLMPELARNVILQKLLTVSGIDLNARDATDASAVSYVAMKGELDVLKKLVEANADVNLACQDGGTPLHFAVLNQHLEMVHYLVKKGADGLAQRSDGKTPLELATTTTLKEILQGKFTSFTHPYTVDFIDNSKCHILGQCSIGMAMCPGRQYHHNWSRDLLMDIEVLKRHRTELVITLMREDELERMQLRNLTKIIKQQGMDSIHYPITDKWLPDSIDDFCYTVNQVVKHIKEGKRIVVHCNGGKGRTGLLIVGCLIKLGLSQYEATEIIRTARPGMLRNPAQQAYLMWIDDKLRHEQQQQQQQYKKTSVLDTIGSFFFPNDQTHHQQNIINLDTPISNPQNVNVVQKITLPELPSDST